jgi:hypothetical protein
VPLIFGLLIIAAIAATAVWRFRMSARRHISTSDAMGWPSAEATVTEWHPQQLALLPATVASERDLWQWSPVIEYVFEAQGEFFAGAFCLAQWVESSEQCLLLASPWLNRKIQIRYKPEDPTRSIFLEVDGAPPGALPPEMQTQQYRGKPVTLSLK